MRGKDLFEKFTNIKEEYIEEVESETARIANTDAKNHRNKSSVYRTWGTLVACIIGLLVVGPFAIEQMRVQNESTSMSTTTTEGTSEGTTLETTPETTQETTQETEVGTEEENMSEATEESMSGAIEGSVSGATEESMSDTIKEGSVATFLAMYVDASTLPVYDLAVEGERIFVDRTVILETSLDNELEVAVYDTYCNSESDEYLCTSILHDISILSVEEVENLATISEWNLDIYVENENLVQTAVVEVDVTWEETHGEIGDGTYEYMPEGRYATYFILGREEGSDEFQVYGVCH